MKIGRGKLLAKGQVSIRVTLEGKTRQVALNMKAAKPNRVAIPFYKKSGWCFHAGCVDPQPWQVESWTASAEIEKVVWLFKGEIDELWAEAQRTLADPEAEARAEKARESSKRGHMKQKLKCAMARVKKCLKQLIAAGADTDALEQDLNELVRETIVEAIQES